MEDERFDQLTRQLTQRTSRRQAIARTLGGALGVVMAVWGADENSAKNRHKHRDKRSRGQEKKSNKQKGVGADTFFSTVTVWGFARCSPVAGYAPGCSKVQFRRNSTGATYTVKANSITGYYSVKVPKNSYYTVIRSGGNTYNKYGCCRTTNYRVNDPLSNQQNLNFADCRRFSYTSSC